MIYLNDREIIFAAADTRGLFTFTFKYKNYVQIQKTHKSTTMLSTLMRKVDLHQKHYLWELLLEILEGSSLNRHQKIASWEELLYFTLVHSYT